MPFYGKVIIFIVVVAGFAWWTRKSLRSFRSHGLYRLLAIASTLTLILLNLDYWFVEPFSLHQLISWLLLTIGTYLVIHGALTLHAIGKPDRARNDTSLIGIEKTTQLVTVGVYRHIRHPIYGSLLFIAWGTFVKHPFWMGVSLALMATLLLTVTAKMEEAGNIQFFGPAYRDYMKRTKMFIPFLF